MSTYDEYLDTIGRLYPDKLMAILEQNDKDDEALKAFDTCLSIEEAEYQASLPGRLLDLSGIITFLILITIITIILGAC